MNSIELMSSMSTMSGTSPLRIAVASFVTYWASGTGVRLIRNRFWVAWNLSTTTLTPVAVAPRHHIVTVPVAFVPKAATVTSGSGKMPEPQAGSVAASPARPDTWRNVRRFSAMSPPRGWLFRVVENCGNQVVRGSQTRIGPIARLAQLKYGTAVTSTSVPSMTAPSGEPTSPAGGYGQSSGAC